MHIDIYSDTICPWCFIGKRRLERALSLRPEIEASIEWRAFQLNPWMPAEGMDRTQYLAAKFGSTDATRVYDTIRQVGANEGIEFRFDRIARTPNTLLSHRLVKFAAEVGRQDAVVEAMFRIYFLEGGDLGDVDTLVEAAKDANIDPAAAREVLSTSDDLDHVLAEDARARRMGIQGVPCFVFDGSYAVSGAQEPEYFLPLFDLIANGVPVPS